VIRTVAGFYNNPTFTSLSYEFEIPAMRTAIAVTE
jgi:hypothetical protein